MTQTVIGPRDIQIDNELYTIDHEPRDLGWGHGGYMAECGRLEWNIFPDSESAGKAARDYWEDMARSDPKEFRCMVGDETLIAWALGESAGPGSVSCSSLEEWLDLSLDHPEEQWASYDGSEHEIRVGFELAEELGLTVGEDGTATAVAYRHN